MAEPRSVDAALTALETALAPLSPRVNVPAQRLDEVELGAPEKVAAAGAAERIDDTLDPAIEALRAALGEL